MTTTARQGVTTLRVAAPLTALVMVLTGCSAGPRSASAPRASASDGPSAVLSTAPSQHLAPRGRRPAGVAAFAVRCDHRVLRVRGHEAGGAAGSVLVDLVVTNTSSRSCTLTGYPGLSWVAGSGGHQVGAAATRSGEPYRTVTLAPGTSATSHARFAVAADYPAGRCAPVRAAGFRVYLPGQTRADFLPHPAEACSAAAVGQLEVRPFGAG